MSRPTGVMIACFLLIAAAPVSAGDWRDIGDGIQYKGIAVDSGRPLDDNSRKALVHFFKIDTLKYRLDVVTAGLFDVSSMDAKAMAKKAGAMVVISGGFFTPGFEPLGLIVQSGREINKAGAGKGQIFQMRYLKPQIISKREYKLIPDIEMALEAGPRILADGKIQDGLPGDRSERSAIGIDRSGKVMFIVTENYPATLTEFTKILKGETCYDALSLSGGDSAQLYAKIGSFELDLRGSRPVANGIGVFHRDQLKRQGR